jgi:huntingtin
MSAIRHCEDKSESSADARSNKSQAVSLPFLLREESLAAVGIDVQSCLHFLFDLYSQFLAHPAETPLVLLTETVRSMVLLSDLFSESSNFWWMLTCLSEVQRVHPVEDEVLSGLLCLGICKAVAVTGGDQETLERTRRTIEICAKSAHLPTKISALYGILFYCQVQ